MLRVIKKGFHSFFEDGPKVFFKKAINYIRWKIVKLMSKDHYYKDVLFINGCTIPAPSRYRVDNQIEQCESSGLYADKVNYDALDPNVVKYYRSFVFYRCPITENVKKLIELAKENNKTTFFDVDDLVIDRKYTDTIKYVKEMNEEDLKLYNDGVNRMNETMKLCDYMITTTGALQRELMNYNKEVFVNRNVISEEVVSISQDALKHKKTNNDKVVIGYLSGSITHNPDFELITPALLKVLKEHDNVYLKIVGLLDIPSEFDEYKDRIETCKFVSYEKLPYLISTIDINLAPITKSIFNEAKSEIKWLEAAMVKVPTVASNYGAFKESITDGVNGILCSDEKEWVKKLNKLIEDSKYRNLIADNAYDHVIKNNVTTYTGLPVSEFIKSKLKKSIAFVLPTTNISGGINVIIKHANILKKAGYDVTFINMDKPDENVINNDGEINVISKENTEFKGHFNKMVASLWSTVYFMNEYDNLDDKYYLVQNYETDFNEFGRPDRLKANATYNMDNIKYITISKWCQDWLKEKFNKDSKYAPNGIKIEQFPFKKRNFNNKINILIEGNSEDYYKNVDEAFKIANKLDKDKFVINYLSYQGEPKKWYKVDNFMHKVPYDEVGKVYQSSDILIKSSILESFSYPPLEMMATGGIAVVAPNGGNIEYLKDKENCLLYELGSIDDAIDKINLLCNDKKLREKLIDGGKKTVESRSWKKIEKDIIMLYED